MIDEVHMGDEQIREAIVAVLNEHGPENEMSLPDLIEGCQRRDVTDVDMISDALLMLLYENKVDFTSSRNLRLSSREAALVSVA